MSLINPGGGRPALPGSVSEFGPWVEQHYPEAPRVARMMRSARGTDALPWWPDWCWVPFQGVWQTIMCDGSGQRMQPEDAEQAMVLTAALSHLASPRAIEVPLDRLPQGTDVLDEPPGMLRGLPGYAPAITIQGHDAVLCPWLDWSVGETRASFMAMVLRSGDPWAPLAPIPLSGFDTIRDAIAGPLQASQEKGVARGFMTPEEVADIDIEDLSESAASALLLTRSLCRPTPHARKPWDHGRPRSRGGHRGNGGRRRR